MTEVPSGVYSAPAEYVDSDHPEVIAKAQALTARTGSCAEAAAAIFAFVRDIAYGAGLRRRRPQLHEL